MRQNNLILASCAAVLLAVSCSVKEDRVSCPVYVTFLADNADRMPAAFLALASQNGNVTEKLFSKDDVLAGKCELLLPKGPYKLSLVGGVSEAVIRNGLLVVDSGKQLDSLYSYIDTVTLDEDDYTVNLSLVKQYCTVAIKVVHEEAEFPDGFTLTVKGGKNGYDPFNPGTPSEGTFHCSSAALSSGDAYNFRVPRQNDMSLSLDIVDNAGSLSLADLPLGEYIARKGYSWKTEGLQDVEVTVKIARTEVGIEIVDWEIVPLPDPKN